MTAAPEADLVRRLAAGDPAALEAAYRFHAARCRAVAYGILGDDALAQDAVQEAFFSLWRHRSGLVVRAAGIGPWLAVVARNAALNSARSTARRAARESDLAPAEADDADPTDRITASIRAAEVRDAVAQLPPDQKTVIAMAYFAHRTLAQIAKRTGAPLGTVKRRAQLALARLARTLGEQ